MFAPEDYAAPELPEYLMAPIDLSPLAARAVAPWRSPEGVPEQVMPRREEVEACMRCPRRAECCDTCRGWDDAMIQMEADLEVERKLLLLRELTRRRSTDKEIRSKLGVGCKKLKRLKAMLAGG